MPENNINKVVYGDRTLIDLTEDTVTEDTLVAGFTAHDRSGASITGTFSETDPTVPSWAKQSTKPSYTASEVGAVATSSVGAASGVAPLNASSKIDESYLPSYVDDVIEGYLYNGSFYKESTHTTVIPGEAGKIYVDLATDKTYRYGGSTFVEISSGTTVSVSRDLTSGTKVGTITVNGTGTDLYAPTPPTAVSQLTNDSGFISTETDPVYSASAAASITSGNITAWNGKAVHHYVTATWEYDEQTGNDELVLSESYNTINTWISNNELVSIKYGEGDIYYLVRRYTDEFGNNVHYLFISSMGETIEITPSAVTWNDEYRFAYNSDIPRYTSDLTNDSNFLQASTSNSEGDTFSINLSGNGTTTAGVFTSFMYNNETKIITPLTIVGNGTTGKVATSIYGVVTPTADDMAANKKYVDDSISGISIPTKTSDLTNDSGFITTETDPTVPSWAKQLSKPTYTPSEVGVHIVTYQITYNEQTEQEEVVLVGATYNDIDTWLGNHEVVILDSRATGMSFYPCGSDRGEYDFSNADGTKIALFSDNTGVIVSNLYISGYDVPNYEEDPIFSASPAAGITSSDITSWNNKVSDDHKWNNITLDTSVIEMSNNSARIPFLWDANGETTARMGKANKVPTANNIAMYDGSAYLKSTTPSANDNSTKVATTAYVDAAIPTVPTTVSSFTNDAGYLTLATLPIYDGTVV